jgi:hypothetical protein
MKPPHLAVLVALSFAVPLAASPLAPQTVEAPPAVEPGSPTQVLVLGSYHFANPGLDVIQIEVADVLSPGKQDEIRGVVEALARFSPSRIAVEVEPSRGSHLDSLYQAYRAGEYDLARNESQQLGFRLAAALGHPCVHPIDHPGGFPFAAVMEYARLHDPAFLGKVGAEMERITAEHTRRQQEDSVGQILRALNDPAQLAADHALYLRFAGVGAGDGYVGAELLSRWYERNLHIFSNLAAMAEPGDRILVIIGAGHAPTLREFVASHPAMVLVDPLEYLPPP